MTDDELKEKIVESWLTNHRDILIDLDKLKIFLGNKYRIKTKGMLPDKVRETARSHLTPDTLDDYISGLPEFGFLIKDIAEVFGVSEYKANKIVKSGEVRCVDKWVKFSDYKTTVHIAYIPDLVSLYKAGKMIHKKEVAYKAVQFVQLIEATDENIAQALYVINKSAKKSRDTKNCKYEDGDHSTCHASKTRMLKLYALKDRTMKKLIDEGRMDYIGINKQEFEDGYVNYLKLYSLSGFTFHVPCESYEVNKDELLESTINNLISSEQTRKTQISFTQAKLLLEKYVA
ncbi:MAG: hypothetical protein LUD12_12290 [Lachnospiraceae bacterium]|nr:hypothetical protein [Lachnospiraceae bacterium]